MTSQPAVLVIVAFKRKRALVRAIAMDIDLPADGGFVFANGLGDSGLSRAVMDAGLNDLAFIKGDMKILIRRSHKRYLRSKRGIQICTKIMIHAGRVNATCSSWRLNATLSPLELHLLFHFTKKQKMQICIQKCLQKSENLLISHLRQLGRVKNGSNPLTKGK